MGVTTAISWTDATVNFWTGCKKVSDGCKYCYMYRDKERYGQDPKTVLRSADATFYAPLRKKALQTPQRVFTCSWSDFFIEEADAWRADAWKVIKQTPHLTYQILTKRPERVLSCLPDDWGDGLDYLHVWLGVTVEHQQAANERIPILANWMGQMNNIFFVSFEPLLGPIDLLQVSGIIATSGNGRGYITAPFDWAILGGESGNDNGKYRYRPSELVWYTDLIDQLRQSETKIFVKQLGTHLANVLGCSHRHGAEPSEWPEYLRIQEFPEHQWDNPRLAAFEYLYGMSEQLRKKVGNAVKNARAGKMTQKDLAEKVGLQQSNIAKLEAGGYNISLDQLEKIADALGLSVEVLLK